MIVTLGSVALEALKRIQYHELNLKTAAAQIHSWNDRVLVPIYHPSPQVLASHRREAEQLQDYQVVAKAIAQHYEQMTEYEAVRDGGAGLIDLSASRGRIRVSGSEATMFLNGLITNDVKNLAAESLDAGGVSDRAGTIDWRRARDSRRVSRGFSSTLRLRRMKRC